MKKLFSKISATVIALVMCLSMLVGCSLVKIDTDRDLAQPVAVVKINQDAPLETIYKVDMMMAYLSYGYQQVQAGQATQQEVFGDIIKELIENRVYVQNAMYEFDKGEAPFENRIIDASITDVYNIDRYLTEEEIIEAEYLTIKSLNDFIDNFMPDDEQSASDSLIEQVRTVPTDATNAEKELTVGQKRDYVLKGVDTNSSAERKKAYNQVLKTLEGNRLLGAYKNDITETDYFQKTLKNYKENTLLENYYNCISTAIRKAISWEDMEKAYAKEYTTQSEWNGSTFISNIKSATAQTPILIGANGTYGYVYNLLLGISDAQTQKVNALKDGANRNALRDAILQETVVKDLRSSWILSGYDFDGEKFTGDYTFTDSANSLAFNGTVKHLNADDVDKDDYRPEYSVLDVNKLSVLEFIDYMEKYLYGGRVSSGTTIEREVSLSSGSAVDYENKIQELLFAYSTDPGSLNTFKGYSITPNNSESWMPEFHEAGKKLLSMGGNSYVIAATDYGYHVMFFSQSLNINDYNYSTLLAYLEANEQAKGETAWKESYSQLQNNYDDYEDTNSYLYVLHNNVATNRVNKAITDKQNKILNTYVYSTNSCVVKFVNNYKDLLGQ